jgi:hypothetical protein
MREYTLKNRSKGSLVHSITKDKVPVDGSSGPSNMLAIGSNS